MPCQQSTRSLYCDDFIKKIKRTFNIHKEPFGTAWFQKTETAVNLPVAVSKKINRTGYVFHMVFWPFLLNILSILSCVYFYSSYNGNIMTLSKPTE